MHLGGLGKTYLYRAYIQMIVRNGMDTLNIVLSMADDGNKLGFPLN